ncbi:MAG: TRAP transporter large permease subunit [Pelagibacteraceae bacterium]|nr:TRAP transporter large permease subunit [Pelagibacteraceae bacterium]MBT5213772.1 TRAP transporter large permease subunit [Pelagibacteraceae bacterium]MBT6197331.1 TRAP transporter large permease subunit [Pelagibacteraceae bacterium]
MELFFLFLLIFLMAFALASGYPLAFALPGSAIISIMLAGFAGYIFEGNANEYFISDGPFQWINAGITNFRGVYWEVERDTLIAIPLFIFMGIMLEKSKIAEDLLISMGQLFGPMPGGLGISVIFVGALLAATTGIVGATVVAMGLISLPAMMKNNYNKSLASGIVCASGTLGQIIPPSIVLIILSDQLATASDAADNLRMMDYKNTTGSMNMPSQFSVESVSAGNMFLGAFLPGLVLVTLYMIYVLLIGVFKKELVPPVKYDGFYNIVFFKKVFLSLVPPLALIFIVLGSILLGVATVNQAGAIGAVGAGIMGGYRLYDGRKHKFTPAIISILSLIIIIILVRSFNLNIKTISNNQDLIAIIIAAVAAIFLIYGIAWSFYRTFKTNNVLKNVMMETSLTTSMVFIILIGAAMLTAAFRGFGGEEIVKDFLSSLPGGFWTQFIVVMAVIFILGFFLDFIEIAIVVVPIVAPILLAETSANVTAVWLGVMIAVNMQTSFLTPPFGFSLFYLRGVAPKSIKTTEIWRGASVFIILQLAGLGVVGYFPQLVNYLPLRSYYSSEVAPPPLNPKLQDCLLDYTYEKYNNNFYQSTNLIDEINSYNLNFIPKSSLKKFNQSIAGFKLSKNLLEEIKISEKEFNQFSVKYKILHSEVRKIDRKIIREISKIEKFKKEIRLEINDQEIELLENKIKNIEKNIEEITYTIPSSWKDEKQKFDNILKKFNKSKIDYNRTVDNSYNETVNFIKMFQNIDKLILLNEGFDKIIKNINLENDQIEKILKDFEKGFNKFNNVSDIKKPIKKARKLIKKNFDKKNDAIKYILDAKNIFLLEISWRLEGKEILLNDLIKLLESGKETFALRKQDKLNREQALYLSSCRSTHRDISLYF